MGPWLSRVPGRAPTHQGAREGIDSSEYGQDEVVQTNNTNLGYGVQPES